MPRDEEERRRRHRDRDEDSEYEREREQRRRERERRRRELNDDESSEVHRERRREGRRQSRYESDTPRDTPRRRDETSAEREARRERKRSRQHDESRRRRDETDAEREARRQRRRREETSAEREARRARRQSRNHNRGAREYEVSRSRGEERWSQSSTQPLNAEALGKLDVGNRDRSTKIPKEARRKRTREVHNEKYEAVYDERARKLTQDHKKRKKRIVSGALLEEGDGRRLKSMRGGGGSPPGGKWDGAAEVRKKRKKWWIVVGCCIVALLILIIVTAVIFSKKDDDGDASDPAAANKPKSTSSGTGSASNIPIEAKGTDLDPFTWLDTKDFNTTYTPELVGGLPVMGLSSEWDDSAQANKKVPALNEAWGPYTSRPARGVNLGGWLSIEPFITPSLFSQFDSKLGVIDEWTLTSRLGSKAKETLEKHYSTFVTEETFKEIADAGLDHVRIPFSYWAIKTYEGDPYVERVAWRYLLRGIEWARKYGLRINLDIHGLPGSQNGWNHSGRQGEIRWNNGTEGATNAARSLEIHDSLSKFFAQPRYKNIITFYGLANEPKMTELTATVVMNWTAQAYELIRGNGITANLVFGDGFMGLEKWQGELQGYDGLVLDVHQYVIFNQGQIVFTKKEKVTYACNGWTDQAEKSMNTATGYGPTMFAEWSQADTDCTTYLNNVGWGNRWTGTYDTGAELTRVLSPRCPTNAIENSEPCSCDLANSDPSTYPAKYKTFLKTFAEAQMHSFERGWGWFYWTWKTESAAQWSYKKGLEIGMLPEKAYERSYNCEGEMPDFEGLPENL